MPDGKCCACGAATPTPQRKACSNRCYEYMRRHPGHIDQPRRCEVCSLGLGPEFHRAARYCSALCRSAASKRRCRTIEAEYVRRTECVHCRAPLTADKRAGSKFCSKLCESREAAGPGSFDYRRTRRCEHCGLALADTERINRRHCSDRCTVLANQLVRRARRVGVPTERFSRIAVFERDDWRCHICGDATDPNAGSRAPFSPSLDHLIPIADPETPGHVWVNVACAHLRCNLAKNHRATQHDRELHERLRAAAA